MPSAFTLLTQQVAEKTTAQVIADEIREMVNNAPKQLLDMHQQPYNKLWKRSEELGVPAQEVLDALGSDGEYIFKLGAELATFILGGYGNTKIADMQNSEYESPFPYTVDNGKITLVI